MELNEKIASLIEQVTDLGFDLKELSKNEFDHELVNSSVDEINNSIALMSGLIE